MTNVDIGATLTLHPGDTLIIRVPPNSPPEDVAEVWERAKELLPNVLVVVVAAEQIAVHRSGD